MQIKDFKPATQENIDKFSKKIQEAMVFYLYLEEVEVET